MHIIKQCSSGPFKALAYETEQRLLGVLGRDQIYQQFAQVPVELFHGFPVGETGPCHYVEKVYGRFPMVALPLETWPGEPVKFEHTTIGKHAFHWRYDLIAQCLIVCDFKLGTCSAFDEVTLDVIETFSDTNFAKNYTTKVKGVYAARPVTCDVCAKR